LWGKGKGTIGAQMRSPFLRYAGCKEQPFGVIFGYRKKRLEEKGGTNYPWTGRRMPPFALDSEPKITWKVEGPKRDFHLMRGEEKTAPRWL